MGGCEQKNAEQARKKEEVCGLNLIPDALVLSFLPPWTFLVRHSAVPVDRKGTLFDRQTSGTPFDRLSSSAMNPSDDRVRQTKDNYSSS